MEQQIAFKLSEGEKIILIFLLFAALLLTDITLGHFETKELPIRAAYRDATSIDVVFEDEDDNLRVINNFNRYVNSGDFLSVYQLRGASGIYYYRKFNIGK